jgi:alpha,alpha-trehalase
MKITLNIEKSLYTLPREDTDQDKNHEDKGPKRFVLVDENTKSRKVISGTSLSNLLQELVLLREQVNELDLAHVEEALLREFLEKL